MKLLISVEPDLSAPAPPPDRLAGLIRGHIDAVRGWASDPKVEASYTLGRNRGFAIVNVESAEEAYEMVSRSPLSRWWAIDISPLFDNAQFSEAGLRQVEEMQG